MANHYSGGAGPSGAASGAGDSHHHHRNKRKRSNASSHSTGGGLYSGILESLENKDSEFVCPICFDLLNEAHMTRCGHTFCYECILRCLDQSTRCPKCNYDLEGKEDIFPNFLLNELVAKHKSSREKAKGAANILCRPEMAELRGFLTDSSSRMGLTDVQYVMTLLSDRKQQLEDESFLTQQRLLKEFLGQLKRLKEDELVRLKRETSVIQCDLDQVQSAIDEFEKMRLEETQQLCTTTAIKDDDEEEEDKSSTAVVPTLEGFNMRKNNGSSTESSLAERRKHMNHHFEDLTECYFSARVQKVLFPPEEEETKEEEKKDDGLQEFSTSLSKFTRYSGLRPLATLSYTTDMFNNASIVSSIEFDKDNELFAIAGVTKRIKIYDYNVVLKDMVDIHYPSMEMMCWSKISCVAWSSFHKATLASSDYDCKVIVWDASTAQKVRVFQEHEKRCWSVDFNLVDTKLLASGSDDARVKLWSTNIQHSVASLEANANVCCVKFNPTSCYHLAFGSADRCVHYYDLRNTKSALNVFRGHKKAVSYVKFLNKEDIVSASTDSQLKLWNVNKKHCLRSFVGHVNEKNFVGLATDGDYITCGSENNGLYVYYRGLSKPLFNFKFDALRPLLDRGERREEEANEFVSAVCWRQNSPVIVAANSQGTIKVLELV